MGSKLSVFHNVVQEVGINRIRSKDSTRETFSDSDLGLSILSRNKNKNKQITIPKFKIVPKSLKKGRKNK